MYIKTLEIVLRPFTSSLNDYMFSGEKKKMTSMLYQVNGCLQVPWKTAEAQIPVMAQGGMGPN